jgi:hypothetical protein
MGTGSNFAAFAKLRAWPRFCSERSGSLAEVDANGAFTLKNVAEGEMRPQINGVPPEYYIKSVRLVQCWRPREGTESHCCLSYSC